MDYLMMARDALEQRQFLEAENYLNKFNSSSHEKTEEYLEIKFKVSSFLASPVLNEDFKGYLETLSFKKKYSSILEIVSNQPKEIKDKFSYIYHYKVEALFMSGRHAEAASTAREHIEFLINKKLYHLCSAEVERYQVYFKNYLFFKIMDLQVCLTTNDFLKADKKWHEVIEILEKKFTKLEDIKNLEKKEIASRCHELILQAEGSGIDVSILNNKALLVFKNYQSLDLTQSDWKKMAELIVHDTSWFNLKLLLELSLEDEEIFAEALKVMKKKKGFDLIKLTRFNKKLKERLIAKRVNVPQVDSGSLPPADLSLEGLIKGSDEISSFFDVSDDELIAVERNVIKSLAFQEMDEKSIVDLVTTFIQLEFFTVAKFLTKRSAEMRLSQETKRKIEYLKIIISTRLNENHLALADISEILSRQDILLEEYVELKYLEAAIFEKIGNTANALSSYKEVGKIDPNYRRLKERMQRFA